MMALPLLADAVPEAVGFSTFYLFATALSVVLLYVGFHTTTYYYSWRIRPNIGLYEEPRWVSKHPAYQKQLRARIENDLWITAKER